MPAVTNVEECTREETGVGADIASGNQTKKGICALLVAVPTLKRMNNTGLSKKKSKYKLFSEKKKSIEIKNMLSPSRLIKKVITPDFNLEKLP